MFLPREWCSKGKAHMRKSMGLGSTGQERWMFPISYQFCPKILKYMYVCLASLPLWLSLVMPGFECKLKGFPRWTICHSSKTSPSQQFTATLTERMRWYPGEENLNKTKEKNWWPKMSKMSLLPPFSQDGFLNPSDRYMSSVGYGFLWNLPSYGSVSITPENISWFSEASQNVDFWVTTIPATTKGMDNCLSILNCTGCLMNDTCELVLSLLFTA